MNKWTTDVFGLKCDLLSITCCLTSYQVVLIIPIHSISLEDRIRELKNYFSVHRSPYPLWALEVRVVLDLHEYQELPFGQFHQRVPGCHWHRLDQRFQVHLAYPLLQEDLQHQKVQVHHRRPKSLHEKNHCWLCYLSKTDSKDDKCLTKSSVVATYS